MDITWKYKIELKDELVFEVYESEYGIRFTQELKDFIKKHNAASPNCDCIMINGTERVFEAVLSFNRDEIEATRFDSAFKAVGDSSVIPFANDPFGNYFCLDEENCISFYNHEENVITKTNIKFDELESKLYVAQG